MARARLAAVLGTPMPTKQTSPSQSALDATTAMVSTLVAPVSSAESLTRRA